MDPGFALLVLSLLSSAAASLLFLSAYRRRDSRHAEIAENALYLSLTLCFASLLLLAYYFLTDNFSVEYVWKNSHRAMASVYKLSATWAGREGSLLLWCLFSLLVASIFTSHGEKDARKLKASAILSAISAYLLLICALTANPFEPFGFAPQDGVGLNPLLRTPEMILHPPIVFLAYALAAVPLAMHVSGMTNADRWMRATFVFLTLGILIGGWWAYRTLGWGGFWGWDPVENASLLPWLAAAAYFHSREKSFFASLTFALVVVAAFVTRSGIIESVHAFAGRGGEFYLLLIAATLAVARPKPDLNGTCSAPSIFVAAIAVVAMGTFANVFFSVERTYYLVTFVPAFALAVAMIIYRLRSVRRKLIIHAGVLLLFLGATSVWFFEKSYDLELSPHAEAAGFSFELLNVTVSEDAEKFTVTAKVASDLGVLEPKMKVYKIERRERTVSSVEIVSTPLFDYYFAIESFGEDFSSAKAKFFVVPLISFVWLGSAAITVGAILRR